MAVDSSPFSFINGAEDKIEGNKKTRKPATSEIPKTCSAYVENPFQNRFSNGGLIEFGHLYFAFDFDIF